MSDPIEFDPVDLISAGALGRPGARRFMIQARKGATLLCVLLEKQQIADLAEEATRFLDGVASDAPHESALDPVNDALCGQLEDTEPLFRARMIGIGYDPERHLVLLELREQPEDFEGIPFEGLTGIEPEFHVARLYATRAQVRAMLRHGAASVERGRPPCPLCDFPMDPDGHHCPRWN